MKNIYNVSYFIACVHYYVLILNTIYLRDNGVIIALTVTHSSTLWTCLSWWLYNIRVCQLGEWGRLSTQYSARWPTPSPSPFRSHQQPTPRPLGVSPWISSLPAKLTLPCSQNWSFYYRNVSYRSILQNSFINVGTNTITTKYFSDWKLFLPRQCYSG